MKVIAFLTDFSAVDKIIRHLKLTFAAAKSPPCNVFEQVVLTAAEGSGSLSPIGRCGGVSYLDRIIGQSFRDFSRCLIWPRGRMYITSVVKRRDSAFGGAVLNAAQKGKSYLYARFLALTGEDESSLPPKTEFTWWSIIERRAYACAFIQDGHTYENPNHNITAAALWPDTEPLASALAEETSADREPNKALNPTANRPTS